MLTQAILKNHLHLIIFLIFRTFLFYKITVITWCRQANIRTAGSWTTSVFLVLAVISVLQYVSFFPANMCVFSYIFSCCTPNNVSNKSQLSKPLIFGYHQYERLSGWALRSTHCSYWGLLNANINMSSGKNFQFYFFPTAHIYDCIKQTSIWAVSRSHRSKWSKIT